MSVDAPPHARAGDPVRFAVGTFTRLPVTPPALMTPTVAARGLALGPAVGAAIGLATSLPLLLTDADLLARLMSAVIVVGLGAWVTRGLHWDGLADVADGLGSGAPADRALQIMRQSDIGPFGVMALMVTAAVQVLGLAMLPAGWDAVAGWVLALAAARTAIAVGCLVGTRPSRPGGLGAMVAGSVTPPLLLGVAAQMGLIGMLVARSSVTLGEAVLLTPLVAMTVALLVRRVAARRLGGTNGDVLGATAEITCAVVLVMITWH